MREIYTKLHENKIYLHISYDNGDDICLILNMEQAEDISRQLAFACQDIYEGQEKMCHSAGEIK